MSWGKMAIGPLAHVNVITGDTYIRAGGTTGTNPLAGARMWDHAAYMLQVKAIMTGTWSVEVHGTVAGITGLPLAHVRGITLARISSGLAGTSSLVYGTSALIMDSATNTPYSLCPSHVLFDNTAAGGISAYVIAVAKTNRGQLPRGTLNRSRVQEGVILTSGSIDANGGSYYDDTVGAAILGITTSTVVTLGNTSPSGTTCFGVLRGLGALQMWDSACYWMDCTGARGLWNIAIQALVPGSATHYVTIAGRSSIGNGTSATTGITKFAFVNIGAAAMLRPSRIRFDNVAEGTGVSGQISGTIVYACKATRGQKRGFGR